MKIKAYSWLLAGAYLLCGVMFFPIVTKSRSMFSEMGMPLPLLTRGVLAIGPFGWLCLAVLGGAIAIFKDLRFRSPWLNMVLTLVLGLFVTCITAAVFLPSLQEIEVRRPAGLPRLNLVFVFTSAFSLQPSAFRMASPPI